MEAEIPDLDDEVLDSILEADGTVSLATIVAQLAAVFGPIEGVQAAPQAVLETSALLSVLAANLEELTPPVRAVFDRLTTSEGAVTLAAETDGPPRDRRGAHPGGAGGEVDADALAGIQAARRHFDERLGTPLTLTITVNQRPLRDPVTGALNFEDAGVIADASLVRGGCLVRLNTTALAGAQRGNYKLALAHELMHCYQAQQGFNLANTPMWIVEGFASWASEEMVGPTSLGRVFWKHWIEDGKPPRWYDGIGLVALAGRASDPYGWAWRLHAAKTAEFLAGIFGGERFFDVWGAHKAGEPSWGAEFRAEGPASVPTLRQQRALLTIGTDGPLVVDKVAARYGTATYEFQASGDILTVEPKRARGGLKVGEAPGVMLEGDGTQRFCITAACVCPDGDAPPGGPLVAARSGRGFIGVVGLGRDESLTLTATTLEDECDPCPPDREGPSRVAHALESPAQDSPVCEPAATTVPTTVAEAGDAECLVGRWVSTAFLGPVPPDGTTSGGAGAIFDFGADGSLRLDFNGMSPYVAVDRRPNGAQFSTVYSGVSSGPYTVRSGAVTAAAGLSTIRVKSTVEVGGASITVFDKTLAELGAGDPGGGFAGLMIECGAGTLRLTRQVPGYGDVPASTVGWALAAG